MTNWLIKLCPSSPRELDRLNRGFPAPSHPDEVTDRDGIRKKVFAMSEKVRIFAPRKHGKFPTLASSTIGVCCVSHGERVAGRQSAWNWTRNRTHNLRWFFKMFSVCFPNALWYTGNQYVFYSPPGYKKVVGWSLFLFYGHSHYRFLFGMFFWPSPQFILI